MNTLAQTMKTAKVALGLTGLLLASAAHASTARQASADTDVPTYTFTYDFSKKEHVMVKQANQLRQYLEFDRLMDIDRQVYNNLLQIGEDVAGLNQIAKQKTFELEQVSTEAE